MAFGCLEKNWIHVWSFLHPRSNNDFANMDGMEDDSIDLLNFGDVLKFVLVGMGYYC